MTEIVFVSTYSLDEPVLRNRLLPFIDRALTQGLQVTLVNPEGGEYPDAGAPGFRHLPLSLPQANHGGLVSRALREPLLAWRVLGAAPRGCDYMVLTVPSMFLLFLERRARAARRLVDLRDLTWEYLSEAGLFRRVCKRLFRGLARRALPRFDLITVTSEAQCRVLHQWPELRDQRILMARNGLSRTQYQALAAAMNTPVAEAERPKLVYVGNVGLAQNLATLIEAARRMPEVDVEIIGAGSDFDRIRALAEGIPNVILRGRLNWGSIPARYAQADVLYAQLTRDYTGAIPSKLYEYLASGKPLVFGGAGPAARLLERFEQVVTVEPETVAALVHAVRGVLEEGGCQEEATESCRFVAEHCVREDVVARVYREFL
jgi:glycosyltransferase involved in cell wall biosynthesis